MPRKPATTCPEQPAELTRSAPDRQALSATSAVIDNGSVAEPGQHLSERLEAMLNPRKGLRPSRSRKIFQQLGAPPHHVIAGCLANHASDDNAVEQKVIAAGCEAVERVG